MYLIKVLELDYGFNTAFYSLIYNMLLAKKVKFVLFNSIYIALVSTVVANLDVVKLLL